MSSERPVVIVNPRAGGGLSERRWARLVGPLTDGLGAFDVRFTERPGDGRRIAREEAGRTLMVALGGDGTISEVAGGLLEAPAARAALGVVPRGTGGDFSRTLEMPHDVGEAARRVAAAVPRTVDAGRVTYTTESGDRETRHFVNVASFGFSSDVAQRANRSSKRMGAKATFLGAAFRSLISYQSAEVWLSVDGGERRRMTLLLGAVGNGRFFGGGMKICPDSLLDDGLLDLTTVRALRPMEVLTKIHRIYGGTHLSMAEVDCARVRSVEVEPVERDLRVPVELDGETPGYLPARFEVVPGALKLRW